MTRPSSQDNVKALYTSVPLASGRRVVRVLDILPSKSLRSGVRGELRVTDLSSALQYEALSYTWGQSLQLRTIKVNGSYRFPVTDNLFNALRRLRQPFSVRTIWTDAICINQSNESEKGHQIALIGDIYANAKCVNVSLGEPGHTNPVYLGHILHVSRWHWFKMKLGHCREEKDWSPLRSSLQNHAKKIDKAIENTDPRWHDRAWIVQEFLLAEEAFLCFGTSRVRFSMHWLRFHVLGESSWPDNLPEFDNFFQKVNSFVQLRSSVAGFGKYPARSDKLYAEGIPASTPYHGVGLYDLIGFLSDTDATEPRDYVYSLLGLVDEQEAKIIASEISISCAQVFAIATYASIDVNQRFDILDHVTRARGTPDLPTWAVDFAFRHNFDPYFGGRHRSHQTDHCIFEKDRRFGISRLALDRSTLHLTMSAGTLGSVVEILPVSEDGGTDSHSFIDFFRRAWSRIPQNSCPVTLRKMCGGKFDASKDQSNERDDSAEEFCSRLMSLFESKFKDSQSYETLLSLMDGLLEESFLMWATLTGFEAFSSYRKWKDQRLEDEHLWVSMAANLWKQRQEHNGGLSVVSTSLGLVMLAPKGIAIDDKVVFARSHEPLLALRQDGNLYTFEGQLKVYGIDGEELLKAWDHINPEEHTFVLR